MATAPPMLLHSLHVEGLPGSPITRTLLSSVDKLWQLGVRGPISIALPRAAFRALSAEADSQRAPDAVAAPRDVTSMVWNFPSGELRVLCGEGEE